MFGLALFLVSLLLSCYSLLPRRKLRDWRGNAISLIGVFGMLNVGLSLYGFAVGMQQHIDRSAYEFYMAKGGLQGVIVGLLISLLLSGSFFRRKRGHEGGVSRQNQIGVDPGA
jgi:hypothetical protein